MIHLERFFLPATLLGLAWLLTLGDRLHPLDRPEPVFFDRSLQVLFDVAWVWVAYLAFEPPARRWWPEILIAWNRLLRGAWRDADVGIGALVGTLVGVALTALAGLVLLIDSPSAATVNAETLNAALGLHRSLAVALGLVPLAIYNSFAIVLQLVLLQFLLRRRRLAIPLAWAVLAASVALLSGGGGGAWLYGAAFSLAAVGVLVRFGLLAFGVAFWVQSLLSSFPLTTNSGAWFAGCGWLAVGLVSAVGATGGWLGANRSR